MFPVRMRRACAGRCTRARFALGGLSRSNLAPFLTPLRLNPCPPGSRCGSLWWITQTFDVDMCCRGSAGKSMNVIHEQKHMLPFGANVCMYPLQARAAKERGFRQCQRCCTSHVRSSSQFQDDWSGPVYQIRRVSLDHSLSSGTRLTVKSQ